MKNSLKVSLVTILSIFLFSCAGKKENFDVNGVWSFYNYEEVYNELFDNMSNYRDNHEKTDFLTDEYIRNYLDKELDKNYINAFVIKDNFYISLRGSERKGIKKLFYPIVIEKGVGTVGFTSENKKPLKFNIIDENTIQLVGSDKKAFRVKSNANLDVKVDRKLLTGTWLGTSKLMINNNLISGEKLDGVHTHKDLIEGKSYGMPFDYLTFEIDKASYVLIHKKGDYTKSELIQFIDRDNFLRISNRKRSKFTRVKD